MRLQLAIVLMSATLAYGQNDDVVSPDRPSFSGSSHIVPSGHLQLEGGAGRVRFGSGSSDDVGELLVRAGISDRIEIRAVLPSYDLARTPGVRLSGASDASIEAKALLKAGGRSAFGVLVSAELPTGSRSVSEHRLQPGATFIWDLNISKSLSLTTNTTYSRATSSGERYNYRSGVSTLNLALPANVGVFAEFYAFNAPGAPTQKYTAGGATWTIRKRTAIDISGGLGLSNDAHGPDRYCSIGVSRLF